MESPSLPKSPRQRPRRSSRGTERPLSLASPSPRDLSNAKGFDVIIRGVLEGAECHTPNDALFARTYWVCGPDWSFLPSLTPASEGQGAPLVRPLDRRTHSEVVTQLSCRSKDPFARFTWAAPFECAMHATNPHGWPQLVVTLHTLTRAGGGERNGDSQTHSSHSPSAMGATGKVRVSEGGGGEQCLAYSRCFIPLRSGSYRRQLPLLQLEPGTQRQSWTAWLMRERPELRDPTFICSGEDRVVLRAAPMRGHVALSLSVTINGFAESGYEP